MTAVPPGEPSPRALGESLAALAVQVADLRRQVRGVVVPEPHGRLHELLLTAAVRSMADASLPSRANVVNGNVPRSEHAGKGS